MENKITASLIISTYNWPQALMLCLESTGRQTVLPDEVIIADDGSDERTKAVVAHFKATLPVPVKHVWHPDAGFQKTIILNKAVAASASDYIIQIDGDVILNKHFISDHLACCEPDAFIRGTRAMLSSELTDKILNDNNITLSPFVKGIGNWNNALRYFPLRWLGCRKEMSSRSVRGSNLSYWKNDFIKVNGYNNNLIGWGHEDEELAARFINNGIIKKIVKFAAVQYHLYHHVSSKVNEHEHVREVKRVVKEKIKICSNGYKILGYE